jgi:DNA-binding LacI/PurR family transcriptional regulator
MTRKRRLTIREVAQAAGVSTQTVSRVINNRPDVAPETYERVQRIITEVGYSPNMLARGLTQGRSHVLGVVAFGLDYFGPTRVLTGIERQAAEMGYSISLNLVHRPESEDVGGILSGLIARQVDGVIWAIPQVGTNLDWWPVRAEQLAVPVVLVGGMAEQASMPSIGIDNHAIGRLATEHLLAGGARHIGLITGPTNWWEAREREAGWRDTLAESGIDDVRGPVVEGDWTAASGEEGLHRLFSTSPRMDAVFASNDQMALGALHAAHALGLRVPEDLAVVGVDDIPEGSHFLPPLTTVHQPLRDAGVLAVRGIDEDIRRLRQRRRPPEALEPWTTRLEPRLIVRQSSRVVA